MDATLQSLVAQLDLEKLEENLFRGQSTDLGNGRVFGGQVIGQAMVAATRTVEDRVPHSLHAYFLLAGDVDAPVVYVVDRVRDGRSFSTRRIQAIQHGRPIFSMIASFHVPEPGLEHQASMPQVPQPEELRPMTELIAEWASPQVAEAFRSVTPIDFRPIAAWNPFDPTVSEPHQALWFRMIDRLPDDPMLHRCMLAYASDHNLIPTALRPHGKSWFKGDMSVASIDHAMWFHRDARVDEWLLYVMDSPSSRGARGFAMGAIYDRTGRLVANVAQEGLMRERTRKD